MPRSFHQTEPVHIRFAVGAEAHTATDLAQLGAERVLLVCSKNHADGAERLRYALGDRCVGIFDGVVPHVPEDVVLRARAMARETGADWVVSHGGGSATGLAKAIALTEDAPDGSPVSVGAVVTTYAGSERTSIWGIRTSKGKQTGRSDRVRPKLVAYDPGLTLDVPLEVSLESLFNAMAQAVARLMSPGGGGDPEAREALEVLVAAVPALAELPTSVPARMEALYGAYLAAGCIESVDLGLHHALAHTLGGTFHARHSAAHTTVLPWSIAFDAPSRPEGLRALQGVFGDDPPAAVYDLAREHGLPHSAKAVGLTRDDVRRWAERTAERGYATSRPVDADALATLCDDIYHARRPSLHSRRRALPVPAPHGGRDVTERGAPLDQAKAVLIAIHGRGAAADRITRDLEAFLEDARGLCILAPQADDNSWYPSPFTEPESANQPHLDHALAVVGHLWEQAVAAVGAEHVIVAGFSQGACLSLTWARKTRASPSALLAYSGAQMPIDGDYTNLASSQVYLGKSARDPYIPQATFDATQADLQAAVPGVQVHVEPGDTHGLYAADGQALRAAVTAALKR